jgi:hypothetical protein
MSAVFCLPQPFTYVSGGQAATAPATNLGYDEPGLVWRSAGLSSVSLVIQTAGLPFDTIALCLNNLRASDSVKVSMGGTAANVNGASPSFSQTISAWSGVAPLGKATTTLLLAAPVSYAFIRLDITSTLNPDNFVEASRLVVGKRVACLGVDLGDEETFEDGSTVDDVAGYTTISQARMRSGRKVTISHLKEADYYSAWRPFLAAAGRTNAFLFMPNDDPAYAYTQQQVMLARINTTAKGASLASDQNRIELTLLSV